MKANFINTEEAPVKWFAAKDARERSEANRSTYSEKEQVFATRTQIGLELVYKVKASHIAYGVHGISIKLEKPQVKDRSNLKLLEDDYSKSGIIKKKSGQGIIYRIPRGVK